MMRRATIFALLLGLSVTGGCETLLGETCPPPGCNPCDPCGEPVGCPRSTFTPSPDACPPSPCAESGPGGRSSQEWAADLRSDDRVTRERAIDALARMGSTGRAEAEVMLSDPSPSVRYSALQVLVRLRGDAAPAIHDVKHRLSDQDPAVRAEAAYVISLSGCHAAQAIPELICALNDPSPVVRYRAATAFQHMNLAGEPGRKALERVSRCDRDPRVREAANCALYNIDQANCRRPAAQSY